MRAVCEAEAVPGIKLKVIERWEGLLNASSKNQTLLPKIRASNLIVVHVASLEVMVVQSFVTKTTLFTSMNVHLMIVMPSIEEKQQGTFILEISNINTSILEVQIS